MRYPPFYASVNKCIIIASKRNHVCVGVRGRRLEQFH